jgi:hypothetical protein
MLVRAQGWPRGPAATLVRAEVGRPPVVRWVLVAAAFLCGLMVSGAAFAIAWQAEARHRDAAEAGLAGQQTRVTELGRRTRALRVTLVRQHAALVRERRQRAGTTHAVIVLRRALQASDSRRAELERNAASVAGAASSLRAELETIVAYVQRGSPLDRGYLNTQLGYVERQAASLRSAAGPAGGANQQ